MFLQASTHIKPTTAPAAQHRVVIQPALEVGRAGDRYEQEADAVADQVMRMPEPTVQRKCAACEEEDKVQRQPMEEEEELQMKPLIQLKADSMGGTEIQPWIQQQIDRSRGGGQSLPGNTRSFMESRMGSSFEGVSIHTDSQAVQMNRELGARAFTVGNDIFFNQGQYAPQSDEGKHLLAHELTHTLQQGRSGSRVESKKMIQRDKLDHKTLSWSDFKGKVPKKAKFDAVTASDIHDPEVAKIKPKEPVVTSSEADCDGESKKGYKARLEYDTSKMEVKSYFDEKTSWKKAWTTEADKQEEKCKTKVVAPCNSKLDKQEKDAKGKAAKDIASCEKSAKKLEEGQYLEYECEDKKVKVYNKGECSSKLKDCFEKHHLEGLSWTYKAHTGQSISATKKADCDTSVLKECKTSLMPNLSKDLLAHEQGHFDITNEIAKQIQRDLRAKADEIATEAEACTEEDAIKKAKTQLKAKKPDTEFNKIWKTGKKKLKETQKKYDSETKHSTISEKQSDWKEMIAAGEI